MVCTTLLRVSTGIARAESSSQGIRREQKDATRGTEIMGLFKERNCVGDNGSADSLLQHIVHRRRLSIIPLQRSCENRRVRLGNPELASCGTATRRPLVGGYQWASIQYSSAIILPTSNKTRKSTEQTAYVKRA